MKQLVFSLFFLCAILKGFGQQLTDSIQTQNDSLTVVDNKYREDQFYVSVTYNLLSNSPDGLSQRGFSSGFHFGFIRDMPINERRNMAVGVGLGLSSNSYNQNMLIEGSTNGSYNYSIIDDDNISFNKNKFTTYLVEMPLEFRWRTSTATEYKFWRIHTGVKVGYVIYNTSKFEGSLGNITNTNIGDLNKLQYGLTISGGYSTWNAYIYYGLNPMFGNSSQIAGQDIDMTSVKIGLIFYIL